MGTVRHDAIIMVVHDFVFYGNSREVKMPDVEAFRAKLLPSFQSLLIGPVMAPVNGYMMYVLLPDGSKDGWETSDQGDDYRNEFRELFSFTYEDGSSPFHGVEVSFGGDERSATAQIFPRSSAVTA